MKGIVQLKVNLVPFKMIKVGNCFLLNQKAYMRISAGSEHIQSMCVCLDDGNVQEIDLDVKVIPMVGSYTLVEESDV